MVFTLKLVYSTSIKIMLLVFISIYLFICGRSCLISLQCINASSPHWIGSVLQLQLQLPRVCWWCTQSIQPLRRVTVNLNWIRHETLTQYKKSDLWQDQRTEGPSVLCQCCGNNDSGCWKKKKTNAAVCCTSGLQFLIVCVFFFPLWLQEVSCCKSAFCHQGLSVRWVWS